MRVLGVTMGVLAVAQGACCAAQQVQPAVSAGQLVREVVYNELHDHQTHGYWRYWVKDRSHGGTSLEEQVETVDGPVARLSLLNGHPLTPEERQEEQIRLQHLLTSPEAQARHLRQYDDDEDRIGRVLAMLPDAFLYEYDGQADGCYHLIFRPNPDYPAHSIEARIFHAMSGTLWVDVRYKRLTLLDGHIEQDVDFGFGILGRLYKGGWFRLQRVQVSPTDWKTESLEVHMNVRALLVKTFAKETSELRGGFVPVPAGLSLAQGMDLLDRTEAMSSPGTPETISLNH